MRCIEVNQIRSWLELKWVVVSPIGKEEPMFIDLARSVWSQVR